MQASAAAARSCRFATPSLHHRQPIPGCQQLSLHHRTQLLRSSHAAGVQHATQNDATNQAEQLAALRRSFTHLEVVKLCSASPGVLSLNCAAWVDFMEGYQISRTAQWKTLRYSAAHLRDPYTAGAAIRWLKELGPWADADVGDRLLPCYPQVLATSADELQAVLDELNRLGFDRSAVQHLLWECPGLLAGEFRAEQMPLVRRMIESRRAKYSQGGTYAD